MASMDPGEITARLLELRGGGDEARERLFASVYEQLKSLARRQLKLGGRTPTLGATALVHEAYLRLVDQTRVDWSDRAHFFAVAAQVMRHILVDHARTRNYAKRGGGAPKLPLDEAVALTEQRAEELIALDDALRDLARLDARRSQIIELRFFGGLTLEETAEVMNMSPSTVQREWRAAKAWLRHTMTSHMKPNES